MVESKGTILYFGNFEMPDKDASAHRVLNNAKVLRDLKYDVVFCGVYKSEPFPQKVMDFANLPRRYPQKTKDWIHDLCSVNHYVQSIKRYPDVYAVIVYDFHALPLVRLRKYCKKRNIKIFGDITEWYENPFSFHPVKLIKWLDTNLVMRWLFKKLDGMIVISDYLEAYYKKSVKKVINIPPLVDIEEKIWHSEYNKNGGASPSFVYSGTTDKTKDKLDVIIKALSKNNETEFIFNVYGLTENDVLSMYPELEPELEKTGDKIRFWGFVSHESSIRALFENSCSLLIRDSTRKNNAGFPTKYVEAITSDIDVITSNISNVRKYTNGGTVMLLQDNTIEAVQEAIANYISGYKTRQRVSLNNTFDYRTWEEEFTELL